MHRPSFQPSIATYFRPLVALALILSLGACSDKKKLEIKKSGANGCQAQCKTSNAQVAGSEFAAMGLMSSSWSELILGEALGHPTTANKNSSCIRSQITNKGQNHSTLRLSSTPNGCRKRQQIMSLNLEFSLTYEGTGDDRHLTKIELANSYNNLKSADLNKWNQEFQIEATYSLERAYNVFTGFKYHKILIQVDSKNPLKYSYEEVLSLESHRHPININKDPISEFKAYAGEGSNGITHKGDIYVDLNENKKLVTYHANVNSQIGGALTHSDLGSGKGHKEHSFFAQLNSSVLPGGLPQVAISACGIPQGLMDLESLILVGSDSKAPKEVKFGGHVVLNSKALRATNGASVVGLVSCEAPMQGRVLAVNERLRNFYDDAHGKIKKARRKGRSGNASAGTEDEPEKQP